MKLGITEAEFTRQVLDLAKLRGWQRVHFRPARTAKGWRTAGSGDVRGFPDVLAIRGWKLLVAELKVPPNRTTVEQEEWLRLFRQVTRHVYTWTPGDWDVIERVLEDA